MRDVLGYVICFILELTNIISQKIKKMRNQKISIENICFLLGIFLLLWVVLSIVDVNAHNLSDQNFAQWNFFQILGELFQTW